jgi:uncharacterized protein YneF (UPF0154 family)
MAVSFVHKKPVDMEKLTIQHEKQIALGNMGVNARGDVLGAGGKILKTREEVMKEYYEANPEINPKAIVNIKYTKEEDNASKKKIDAVLNPPVAELNSVSAKSEPVVSRKTKTSKIEQAFENVAKDE